MAASSLSLPSLHPQIPTISSKPKPTPTVAFSFPAKPFSSIRPLSLFPSSCASLFPRKVRPFQVGFVPNVAVSSELGQEEEEEEEEAGEFSPELKLFVGNLPFSVDSAQLAGLFERAGNVEMVEV